MVKEPGCYLLSETSGKQKGTFDSNFKKIKICYLGLKTTVVSVSTTF